LFNNNSAIFQLYHGESKLIFKEMMRSALYYTNMLSWICLYFCIQLIRNEWFWMFLYVVTLCENDCYVESDWLAGNQDNVSESDRGNQQLYAPLKIKHQSLLNLSLVRQKKNICVFPVFNFRKFQ
jgi:hypothetical protein